MFWNQNTRFPFYTIRLLIITNTSLMTSETTGTYQTQSDKNQSENHDRNLRKDNKIYKIRVVQECNAPTIWKIDGVVLRRETLDLI